LFDIECVFDSRVHVEFLDQAAAGHLYHIIQEAVHNAVKHAQCSRISVSMVPLEGFLHVSVQDNGQGMACRSTPDSGLGFHTMSYRANALGGQIEIGHADDGGFAVRCEIPLEKGCIRMSDKGLRRF
jgi:signal transduction histidine kinase